MELAEAEVSMVPAPRARREMAGWARKASQTRGEGAASAQPASAVETTRPVRRAFERAAHTLIHFTGPTRLRWEQLAGESTALFARYEDGNEKRLKKKIDSGGCFATQVRIHGTQREVLRQR